MDAERDLEKDEEIWYTIFISLLLGSYCEVYSK